MLRPTTASTSTTSDSPPPQSPITPPPYERLPPFYKVQIVEDGDVRMEDCESPRSHSLSFPTPKRPLSPSHNDYQLPKLSLDRISSFPMPPSGHDLMHLFPFQPSRITDLNRNTRTSPTSPSQGTKPAYINTSTYFVQEEREFFRTIRSVTGRDLEIRLEKEREKGLSKGRGNNEVSPKTTAATLSIMEPSDSRIHNASTSSTHTLILGLDSEPAVKRRKSIDSGKIDCQAAPSSSSSSSNSIPPPPLALGNVRQRVYQPPSPPQQQHLSSKSSQPRSQNRSPTSSQINTQPVVICQNPPSSSTNPAPRRRAGKYTKRVFVHPNPLPNVNPPYLLANVYPPSPNDMNPTINVYPLANPLPQKTSVPYPPSSPPHSVFPHPSHCTSQFIEFAR